MKCKDCLNYDGEYKDYSTCKLRNVLLRKDVSGVEQKCAYFNADMTQAPVCYSCKYFLGGADWGLACKKNYYKLCHALDPKCEEYELKGSVGNE